MAKGNNSRKKEAKKPSAKQKAKNAKSISQIATEPVVVGKKVKNEKQN